MKRQFYDYRKRNASVAATANWSVPTASLEFGMEKPTSPIKTPVWNVVPALRTAPPTPFMSIQMMAAAVPPISLTAGLPEHGARFLRAVVAEFCLHPQSTATTGTCYFS